MSPKTTTNETITSDGEIKELSAFLGLSDEETRTTINNLKNP